MLGLLRPIDVVANISCGASRLKKVEQRLNKLQSLCSLAGLVDSDRLDPLTINSDSTSAVLTESDGSKKPRSPSATREFPDARSTGSQGAPLWTFPHGAFLPASSTILSSWEGNRCAEVEKPTPSIDEPNGTPGRSWDLPPSEHYRQTLAIIFADGSETRVLSELDMSGPPGLNDMLELPPVDTTFLVVRHLLEHLNTIVPLYDEHAAFHLLEVCYKQNASPQPDVAAYVYSLVALAYACSGDTSLHTDESVERAAWTFFGRAARYVPQLMAGTESLLSTQATLSMVCIRQERIFFNGHLRDSRHYSWSSMVLLRQACI